MDEQRQQFKLQQDSINRQNFENTFFQLLGLHNQIVSDMKRADDRMLEGRECFNYWYKLFLCNPWGRETDDEGKVVRPAAASPSERYTFFYTGRQDALGHYFRNLYHVIKFVKESEALKNEDSAIEYKNRRRYTSLVRATLSQNELALLFYNCISPLGQEKFKPLIEEFGLLENFDRKSLWKKEDEHLYARKAFE